MKSIIYAYEEQVVQLLQNQPIGDVRGIALGWADEDVYHVFSKIPTNAPTGRFMPCCFRVFTENEFQEAHVTAYNQGKAMLNGLNENPLLLRKVIYIALCISGTQLQKKCYAVDATSEVNNLEECDMRYVPKKSELYSRSKGLLEVDVLENKRVAIIGLGSFGSFVAVELAKAGLGHFKLFDFDRLELSNVARHMCGVNDLGRFKTKAIRDLIVNKNPHAQVSTFEVDINADVPKFQADMADCDLIICLTDENQSRYNINDTALRLGKVALFSRAITRAEGGDVFVLRPGGEQPCLACVIGKGLFSFKSEEVSNLRQAKVKSPEYMSEDDVNATIQVGLSSDIVPICTMVVKLALFELAKGSNTQVASLNEDLVSNYYLWANRRETAYRSWLPMQYFANRPSILRWYGVKTKKQADCMACSLSSATENKAATQDIPVSQGDPTDDLANPFD